MGLRLKNRGDTEGRDCLKKRKRGGGGGGGGTGARTVCRFKGELGKKEGGGCF